PSFRRRCSKRPSSAPASSWPSWTARPRAGPSSASSANWGCRSSSSASAKSSTTWSRSTPTPTSRPSSRTKTPHSPSPRPAPGGLFWFISMSEMSLVTGGAGFIGSHLVEALVQEGRPVRVLDNFDTGLRFNLEHIHPAPEIVEGDLGDPDAVRGAVAGARVVYHLGALASVQRSVDAPAASHRVCATGSLHLLDAARRAGVRRVVYAASSSAYGIPAGEVQTEADPVRPLSPYAAAKLAGELYA